MQYIVISNCQNSISNLSYYKCAEIRLVASFSQNIHFTLAAAILSACQTLVVEATSDIG